MQAASGSVHAPSTTPSASHAAPSVQASFPDVVPLHSTKQSVDPGPPPGKQSAPGQAASAVARSAAIRKTTAGERIGRNAGGANPSRQSVPGRDPAERTLRRLELPSTERAATPGRRSAICPGVTNARPDAVRRTARASGNLGDVRRLKTLRTLRDLERHPLSLVEGAEAGTRDRRVVHEHVLALVGGDEPVTLLAVEPLYLAGSHVVPSFNSPASDARKNVFLDRERAVDTTAPHRLATSARFRPPRRTCLANARTL